MEDFFFSIIEWVDGLPPWLQVVALLLVGAIPFIESFLGSAIGIILGINVFLVVPAVVIGNIVCTFLLMALAGRARDAATRDRQGEPEEEPSKRRQRVEKFLSRFGVPGVMLLGPITFPSQIVAPLLVGLGANRRSVYIWTAIGITLWGVGTAIVLLWLLGAVDYPYADYPY